MSSAFQLGAEPQRVTVTDRNQQMVATVPASATHAIQWERRGEMSSNAGIDITVPAELGGSLEPWFHRVCVWRGEDLVWRGPIVRTEVTGSRVSIEAVDPSIWLYRRAVTQTRSFTAQDLSVIAAQLVRDAMADNDPDRLIDHMMVVPTGIVTSLEVTAGTRYVADELADLVDLGLRWQVCAGVLVIGPVADSVEHDQPLGDRDFTAALTVIKNGEATVTDAIVQGGSATGRATVPSELGKLVSIIRADSADTVTACTRRALEEVNRYGRTPRTLEVPRSARLTGQAPIPLPMLVPGVRVPVHTDRQGLSVSAMMRIESLSVVSDGTAEAIVPVFAEAPAPIDPIVLAEMVPPPAPTQIIPVQNASSARRKTCLWIKFLFFSWKVCW
ncbi:hypothetical protein QYN14_00085 [Rhodococcus ruber]|uniref:hypothetical protein n=1 Tax=Rhodococcus ruber TaxID=1830 RepID=UPI0026585214|nr:hypothetical protein [Rhodococcus ruber]WKK11983.1 hypothetical protein QYN14_25475 [Rhodococcus ruber]WKK12056.1 hypothetical protein QYN14_00085 [Rhodococcus ruber]